MDKRLKPRFGMVVAVEIESVMNRYIDRLVEERVKGFKVYSIDFGEKILYIAQSGAGEIRAAACAEKAAAVCLSVVDRIIKDMPWTRRFNH